MAPSPRSPCSSPPCVAPALAFFACAILAFLYVALLHAPSLILRLPPPVSLRQLMIRRFAGAISATLLSLLLSHQILYRNVKTEMNVISWLPVFGLRYHHLWQAVAYPVALTSLLYLVPLAAAVQEIYSNWQQSYYYSSFWKEMAQGFQLNLKYLTRDVLFWRNFVLAPLTEEIVFRSCMIPLLLCAGLQPITIIFICPVFFGLAHINRFWDLLHVQNIATNKALLIVGVQLCYTTVFGWYASYLYLRTGNILAPLSAHIFCNVMGLPDLNLMLRNRGLIFVFLIGIVSFTFLLAPISHPSLHNYMHGACDCWLGYCRWK